MKISNHPNPQLPQGVGKSDGVDKKEASNTSDTQKMQKEIAKEASHVEISDMARSLNDARSIVASVPNVNAARVQELKARIQSGNYHVSAEDVADKIIEEHLQFHFGKNQV